MSANYKDCPQDIRTLAAQIVAGFGSDPALLEGAIAAALDSEREGCIRLCDTEIETARKFGPHHVPIIAGIRDAIRKRGQ